MQYNNENGFEYKTFGAIHTQNGVLVGFKTQQITNSLEGFLSQPLPVLARLTLREVVNAIYDRMKLVQEANVELIKKHGGVELSPGNWFIKTTDPSWPAYFSELQQLGAATYALPIEKKIQIPAKVPYRGELVEIAIDGLAAAVLNDAIEVMHEGRAYSPVHACSDTQPKQ